MAKHGKKLTRAKAPKPEPPAVTETHLDEATGESVTETTTGPIETPPAEAPAPDTAATPTDRAPESVTAHHRSAPATHGAGHTPVVPKWAIISAEKEADPFTFREFASSKELACQRAWTQYAGHVCVLVLEVVGAYGPSGTTYGTRSGIDGMQAY